MSAVEQAIEVGARAIGRDMDLTTTGTRAVATSQTVVRDAWPILSAPLRGLHVWEIRGAEKVCRVCWATSTGDGPRWPCPTIRLIEQTDKELGL